MKGNVGHINISAEFSARAFYNRPTATNSALTQMKHVDFFKQHKDLSKRSYPDRPEPEEARRMRDLGIRKECWSVFRKFDHNHGYLSAQDRKVRFSL